MLEDLQFAFLIWESMSIIGSVARAKKAKQNVDRISNLPSEVIQHILEFLPLKDSVRTSILSTHWRHQWNRLPRLILDEQFFRGILRLTGLLCRNLSCDVVEYPKFVSKILLCHCGPMQEFELYIPNRVYREEDISSWIQFISGKFVQQFHLEYESNIMESKLEKIPSCMFSCVGFENLTELRFVNVRHVSLPTTFRGFPSLTTLHVDSIIHRTFVQTSGMANILGTLVSKCPLLENLDLRIKEEQSYLTIRAPKLKRLVVVGWLSGICLEEETEGIVDLSLYTRLEHKDTMMKFFGLRHRLEELTIGYDFWQAQWLREVGHHELKLQIPSELKKLKHLMLESVSLHSRHAVSMLLCLLKMGINLEKLDIDVYSTGQIEDNNMLGCDDCIFHHLKYAKLSLFFSTSRITLQLIKLILLSSPILEEMTVEAKGTDEEKLNAAKELLNYHRASTKAGIIFKN